MRRRQASAALTMRERPPRRRKSLSSSMLRRLAATGLRKNYDFVIFLMNQNHPHHYPYPQWGQGFTIIIIELILIIRPSCVKLSHHTELGHFGRPSFASRKVAVVSLSGGYRWSRVRRPASPIPPRTGSFGGNRAKLPLSTEMPVPVHRPRPQSHLGREKKVCTTIWPSLRRVGGGFSLERFFQHDA